MNPFSIYNAIKRVVKAAQMGTMLSSDIPKYQNVNDCIMFHLVCVFFFPPSFLLTESFEVKKTKGERGAINILPTDIRVI